MENRSVYSCRPRTAAILVFFVIIGGNLAKMFGESRTYRYEAGQPPNGIVRTHEVNIPDATGELWAYASFGGVASNPGSYEKNEPRGQQVLTIGYRKGDRFSPAVQFGIANNKDFLQAAEGVAGQTFLTPWLSQGGLEYYGDYLRQGTQCDFKLKISLKDSRVAIWYSSRGDHQWHLLGENLPLISRMDAINYVRVEQSPAASGVADVVIQSEPWPDGEKVKPHPLAKKAGIVGPDNGFHFQSMRSTWRVPGRHVQIVRQPLRWFGFPM